MIAVDIGDGRVSVSDGSIRMADYLDPLSLLTVEISPSGDGEKVAVRASVVIQGNRAGVLKADADTVDLASDACRRGLIIRAPASDGRMRRIPRSWLGKTVVARSGRLSTEEIPEASA
ncbi:MAG: hypothetical protein LKJ94_07205 [Candidatus Methanomethylophilus sp.]|jgi:hypothetical protein|nr:hypothetical protein [Methanomethylophilus sp.]MCI2093280.1 hypothetical protein [Methanomethylophilus sp.]